MEEKKAFNGKDMVRQFKELRQTIGSDKKIAAFGDNASINKCKIVREACADPAIDIKQWFNVTYRPDLHGINVIWEKARAHHSKRLTYLDSKELPVDNMALVKECLERFSSGAVKHLA